MDYYIKYQKYRQLYKSCKADGGAAKLDTRVTATFTLRGPNAPCLVVLDLEDSDLTHACEIFTELIHSSPDEEGCQASLPSSTGRIKKKYGCFGPRQLLPEKGTVAMAECSGGNVAEGVINNFIESTCTLFTSQLGIRDMTSSGTGHHITVNDYEPFIEAHRYATHHECPVPKIPFTWHKDDHAVVNFPTLTAIFYLHKSESGPTPFQGGNFECAFPEDSVILWKAPGSDVRLIEEGQRHPEKEDLSVYSIPTKSNRVILMRGDIWHIPTDLLVTCHGCRDSVVVQVARPSI